VSTWTSLWNKIRKFFGWRPRPKPVAPPPDPVPDPEPVPDPIPDPVPVVNRGRLILWHAGAEGKDVHVYEDGYEPTIIGPCTASACRGICSYAADAFGDESLRGDVSLKVVCEPVAWSDVGWNGATYVDDGSPARVPIAVKYIGYSTRGVMYYSTHGPADCFPSDHWEVVYKNQHRQLFSPNMKTASGTFYGSERIDAHTDRPY